MKTWKKLVLAGALVLPILGFNADLFALGTQTVNSVLIKRIDTPKVSGFVATIWENYSHGTTAAYFNAYNRVGTTAASLAGSTTIANGSIDTSGIYDAKTICLSYAAINVNGTPTFKIYGLNGTTTTGVLCPITRTTTNQVQPNPWIPTTTTGTSAVFVVSEYYERMAISVEAATAGTTTGIFGSIAAVNEIP